MPPAPTRRSRLDHLEKGAREENDARDQIEPKSFTSMLLLLHLPYVTNRGSTRAMGMQLLQASRKKASRAATP
jgi:hypothetical protein